MTALLRVAVVGLGAMGLPMAERLSAELEVVGFDSAPDRTEAAEAAGIELGATPAASAAGAHVLVLAVRTLAQCEAALFGADGAVGALKPGSVVILTSTIGSEGAASLAERLAGHSIHLLDLPVSGGPARAGNGDLLVFMGGTAEAAAAAMPVVDLLASTVAVVGRKAGDGQAMKTVNQLLCGVHIAAAAEALSLAQALGLDPAVTLEAISAGAAASFMLSNRGPRIVEALAGDEPGVMSRVDIFVKDLRIVDAAAGSVGLDLDVASAAERLFNRADSTGFGAEDDSMIARVIQHGHVAAEASSPSSPGRTT